MYDHPTIKPLQFVKNHILSSTKEGDIILDTFVGSGTTAVACVETNRNFIGFEKDEKYFEIANERIKCAVSGVSLPSYYKNKKIIKTNLFDIEK